MNWFWLLRMRRWAQNPPSARQVKLVLGIVAICLALFAVERWIGWPAFLSVDPARAPMRLRP